METRSQSWVRRWRVFWLWRGGYNRRGRLASYLAGIGIGGYRHRHVLSRWTPRGYVAPSAEVIDLDPVLGANIFVGERSVLARWAGTGSIQLDDRVTIHRDCTLEIVEEGSIQVGADTSFERGCVLFSAKHPIRFGQHVEVASYCAFYSYDHGMAPDRPIHVQGLTSKGPIVIQDDAWLGVGVTVLSGVTIGQGAVIGAGSVVTKDIPPGAIAAGMPAKVVKFRHELADNPR